MKVVKLMEPEKFEEVCLAGAEAFFSVCESVRLRGIGSEQLVNISTIIMAGVLKTFGLTLADVSEGIELAERFWSVEEGDPQRARFALPSTTGRPIGEN